MTIDHATDETQDTPWSTDLVWAVLRHPSLWGTALRLGWSARRPKWWTSTPFLPLPSKSYLSFRFEIQYGANGGSGASSDDVIEYLKWVRRSSH